MSKKLFNTIILINHVFVAFGLLNLPQSVLPTLPGIGSIHQTVVEELSSVHAPASTTVCMLGDAFITSFCTGHVGAPNKVPACSFLLSHRPSDLRGSVSLRSVLMHGVEASPCYLHCLGSKHPDVCTRSSHHSALGYFRLYESNYNIMYKCRSWSGGFTWSQLIRICYVYSYLRTRLMT